MGRGKVESEEMEAARADYDPEKSPCELEAEYDSWGRKKGVELKKVTVHLHVVLRWRRPERV